MCQANVYTPLILVRGEYMLYTNNCFQERRMKLTLSAFIIMLAICLQCDAGEIPITKYELQSALSASDVLPTSLVRSEYHRVLDDIDYDGFFIQFNIETDNGIETVKSRPLLKIRIHEAQAIAEVNNGLQRQSNLAKSSKENRPDAPDERTTDAGITRGVQGDSATHPQMKLIGGKKSRADKITEFSVSDTSDISSNLSDDYIFQAHKRAVAARLQLDVYSSNPTIQTLLDRLARELAQGRTTLGSSFTIERDPETRLGQGEIDAGIRRNLKDKTPADLRLHNEKILARLGVSADLQKRFLDHSVLTPRHKSFISAYINQLGDIKGLDSLFEAVLKVNNETEALSYEQLARLLAVYNEKVEALAKVELDGSTASANTMSGALVIMMPADIIYWSKDIEAIIEHTKAAYPGDQTRMELVVPGVMTDIALQAIEARGFKVRDRYLSRR